MTQLKCKAPGVFEVDNFTTLSAQIDAMRTEIKKLTAAQAQPQVQAVQQANLFCEVCGEGHTSDICPANPTSIYFVCNAVKGRGNNNQYGNSYNPNWRNHLNFSMVEMMKKMMSDMQKMIIDQQKLIADNQNHDLAVWNLERQMGQMAGAQNTRPPGALPSDTDVNPKPYNAVTLRNGSELEEVTPKKTSLVRAEKEKIAEEMIKEERVVETPVVKQPLPEVAKPSPPFPQCLARQKEKSTYKKFLDLLKQGIPKYAKYIKDIIANKSRFTEYATVALTEECTSRIQNRLPTKLKDPGCFTIEISIGKEVIARA
ncbi:uncharacterized protein LOC132062266 [Lycium ferocissimum]|uniref:uncharacterized protein LOC132062266 n=1 Tax=Lycium ferocissimum TaxID=112874 RepID=UPI002814B1BF|nr:uncharacterized protein LOC132062266 [Lycium ferocissimum]